MFAVSRFAHYLKCMVRDKIGSTKEKDAAAALAAGVDQRIRRRRSGQLDARRPRRASRSRTPRSRSSRTRRIPGYYSARFYLRPHYQLEGMDIGLSLVSRLPAPSDMHVRTEHGTQQRARFCSCPDAVANGIARRLDEPTAASLIQRAARARRMSNDAAAAMEAFQWQSISFWKLDGIKGESKDDKHKDEIDVLSWSWGMSPVRAPRTWAVAPAPARSTSRTSTSRTTSTSRRRP